MTFYRVSISRDIDIAILSVRPSVRDVPVSDENGLTYCHSFFTIQQPNHSSFISIKHQTQSFLLKYMDMRTDLGNTFYQVNIVSQNNCTPVIF